MQTNERLKKLIKDKNIKLWQVAYKLGLRDSNFSRMLRYELTEEQLKKINKAISELEAKNNGW